SVGLWVPCWQERRPPRARRRRALESLATERRAVRHGDHLVLHADGDVTLARDDLDRHLDPAHGLAAVGIARLDASRDLVAEEVQPILRFDLTDRAPH